MMPNNPAIGGTILRRASEQSPNFVTGVSGWALFQDGSAEFANLVVRAGSTFEGTDFVVNAAGAFWYDTVQGPGLGTLSTSITSAAGTDSYGNNYNAGVSVFQVVAKGSGQPTLVASIDPDNNIQFGPGTSGNPGVYINGATGQMLASSISAFKPGTAGEEGWTEFAIPSGWSDHSTPTGNGFRYKMEANNAVRLEVNMQGPSSAPANGTVLATLPLSYRPSVNQTIVLAGTPNGQTPHFDIHTNGQIVTEHIAGSNDVVSGSVNFALD